ncbi:unnamed protein product, partial [Rotaria magnacalcarata]
MFSLQQNIDTYELNVILNDNLPEGIKINILQEQFSYIDGTLSDNDPQAFGLGCLLYLHEQTNMAIKITKN